MSDAVTITLFLVDKVLLSFLKKELNRDGKALDDVQKIKGHLTSFQACLQDAEGREGTSQMMKALVEDIRDVGHEMEDVLDHFMIHAPRAFSTTDWIQKGYKVCHDVKHWIPVHGIQSKITRIDASVLKIKSSAEYLELVRIVHRREGSSHNHPHREEAGRIHDDEIMGIDSSEGCLINQLLDERSNRCKAIFVVGPSGAGKTVLVRRAYKRRMVNGQFHCHAWLSLSYTDNPEQRLEYLLTQFFGMRINELHSPVGAGAAMKLENYLGDKKYLVVLDGIRKDEEWTSIKQALPDHSNGSRIIITTQDEGVATRCSSSNDHIFRVKGLEWKDSWGLFCKKAYGGEKCPDELVELSEMIVKRCEGLPQPISAVGNLLSRKPRLPEEWNNVHDNLATEMQANCVGTMFLPSYYDLPSNQKSCLLYFSLFPEDYSIKRERLIRLWLSEGFVDESGDASPEKIAEDSLNELISRNLVDASSRDFRGRVKSCRVLNLMRQFICQKSKEKKFAAVVTDRDVHKRDGPIYRRLSIENASSGLSRTKGLHLDSVRSLFMFGLDKASSKMIAATLKRIKLLKVLDLENATLDSFPECVLDAALLRYLSLRNTNVNEIPKTIERLRYLEYLDLKQTQVTCLPEEIFSLEYLQHLLVYRCSPMSYDSIERLQGVQIEGQIVGEMRVWPVIQKLSIIKCAHTPRFFEMLGQLTLLKKLGLSNLRKEDGLILCSCIEIMPHLLTLDLTSSMEENLDLEHMNKDACPSYLRHLYLKGMLTILPTWIPYLTNLVKLLLRGSKLVASPVEKLGLLPNLMELEMTDAFTGEFLLFEEGSFPNLRTLYIENFDHLDTMVCHGGMRILRKLSISGCKNFCDLPSGIEGLEYLEEFLLYNMPQDLTYKLDKTSEEGWKIQHVPIIKFFYVSAESSTWVLENFS